MIFFFFSDFWFGLFQVLTLDVFHYRKIRKILDLVFIFICRTLKKKEGVLYSRSAIAMRPRASIFNILAF